MCSAIFVRSSNLEKKSYLYRDTKKKATPNPLGSNKVT